MRSESVVSAVVILVWRLSPQLVLASLQCGGPLRGLRLGGACVWWQRWQNLVILRLVVRRGRWGAVGYDEGWGGSLTRMKRVLDQRGFSTRRPAEKGDWVPGHCQQRRRRTWVAPYTAVRPKIPHSNCCKIVPNRSLRGRRGRFGTLLQLLECGIFGRTAVAPTEKADLWPTWRQETCSDASQ